MSNTPRILFSLTAIMFSLQTYAIMAGGEFDLPDDFPSNRLDTANRFPFVGALSVSNGGSSFFGSGVAISPDWVLTAAHNTDFNDDGMVDGGWSGSFHLPGLGSRTFVSATNHPDFSGFGQPNQNDDLALLRLSSPLPSGLAYPGFGGPVSTGVELTLVGFGRSGFGSYGYTTNAGLTDRRSGRNVVDGLLADDEGSGLYELFEYDFDTPDTTGQPGGSLGNDIETLIGPGDSGGAALTGGPGNWSLVGINTYTYASGGLFGDTGGGVLVHPYHEWIAQTTGLAIPEPGTLGLLGVGILLLRCFVSSTRPRAS